MFFQQIIRVGISISRHGKSAESPVFRPAFVSAQIEMVPQNYQTLDNEEHVKLMEKLIDIMEEDDDVQNVWHNWEE